MHSHLVNLSDIMPCTLTPSLQLIRRLRHVLSHLTSCHALSLHVFNLSHVAFTSHHALSHHAVNLSDVVTSCTDITHSTYQTLSCHALTSRTLLIRRCHVMHSYTKMKQSMGDNKTPPITDWHIKFDLLRCRNLPVKIFKTSLKKIILHNWTINARHEKLQNVCVTPSLSYTSIYLHCHSSR